MIKRQFQRNANKRKLTKLGLDILQKEHSISNITGFLAVLVIETTIRRRHFNNKSFVFITRPCFKVP